MKPSGPHKLAPIGLALACFLPVVLAWGWPVGSRVEALGKNSGIDIRRVRTSDSAEDVRPKAAQRLAWEVRKRTSIDTVLEPTTTRFDDPSVYLTPFLYWAADRAFAPLAEAEISGLRRFVEYGGFILVDDAAAEQDGFDQSLRQTLKRAFPTERLLKLPASHTLYRSFYLLDRPVGRVAEPDYLEAIMVSGRAAIVYSRHDLGGAWVRDDDTSNAFDIVPGGFAQREQAIRLGVNAVMYALCLDYKDDQVHAPFILRRRGGRP